MKKQPVTTFILLLFSAFVLLLNGCKKEQPQLNTSVDCDCAEETSADFEILEMEAPSQFDPIGTDTDTIFGNKNVLFKAKQANATYTWYIGSEVLSGQQVGRYFSAATYGGQDITVSLVVKRQANQICFPNDDGYDSISKTFHVQPYVACSNINEYINDTTLMEGIYRMKSEDQTDSFDVVIDYIDRQTAYQQEIDILNFDGQGTNLISEPRCSIYTLINYRQLWINNTSVAAHALKGYFLYKMDGTALFEFTTHQLINGAYVDTYYKLTGRKL